MVLLAGSGQSGAVAPAAGKTFFIRIPVFGLFQTQTDTVALFVDADDDRFYNVADADYIQRVAEASVRQFAAVDQAAGFQADIYKNAEIDDILDCTLDDAADFQIAQLSDFLRVSGAGASSRGSRPGRASASRISVTVGRPASSLAARAAASALAAAS